MFSFQNKNTLRSDIQSVIIIKYIGVGITLIAISLIATPIGSLFLFLPFMSPFLFGITVAEIRVTKHSIQYRHYFLPWRTIKHTDIIKVGKIWVYGYIKLSKPVMPWGRLYFIDADKMPFRRWPILHYLESIVNHSNAEIVEGHFNEGTHNKHHSLLRLLAFIIGIVSALLPALLAPNIYYNDDKYLMIHSILVRKIIMVIDYPMHWPWSLAIIVIVTLWAKYRNELRSILYSFILGICSCYIIIFGILWKAYNIKI